MVAFATLQDLGFSQKTIDEEDMVTLQFGGLFPMTKLYSFIVFAHYAVALLLIPGMIIKCYQWDERSVALESANLLMIVINMGLQTVVYHYYSPTTTKLFRAINDGFFSYGDTMDDDTSKAVQQAAEEKAERKKVIGKTFKMLVGISSFVAQVKRPFLHLLNGHGFKDVDGMDWLIYESPTGLYMPFSNYWLPYILGMVVSYSITQILSVTVASSATCFSRFCEELLHQLYIIKLGLRNVTLRANHLHNLRYGKDLTPNNKSRFDSCLKECLDSSVKHHHLITKLFEDFKVLMYLPLFTVLFDGGALICLSTTVAITNDSVSIRTSTLLFLMSELYYTYLYCGYGEQLTQAFAGIGEVLYSDDWLEHRQVMKPYMIIINANSLIPKKLSAAGFTSPNRENFGNVIRTAYTLLNFLVTQN